MIDADKSAERKGVLGVGVDVVEFDRFKKLKRPERIAELVLTPIEYDIYIAHPATLLYLASRFAAKEAVIKAYPGELHYHDFEIIKEGKKPRVKLLIPNPFKLRMFVSLSHSTDYVAGFAVAV